MILHLRKRPGTVCAEVIYDSVVIGEVEYMNFPPGSLGVGDAWRWRDCDGKWGNAATQEDAVAVVLDRYLHPR